MQNNIAFIDAQNLNLGVKNDDWAVDWVKFRNYLRDKYNIQRAYYFVGFFKEDNRALYDKLEKAGFIVVFREHAPLMSSRKKGNVDVDIVFDIMQKIADDRESFDKIALVSGDGDFYKLVQYLIQKDAFLKIMFPSGKSASSLYNKLDNKFKLNLGRDNIMAIIKR